MAEPSAEYSGQTVVILSAQALSLWNFRASLIGAWLARGARVLALAPDIDDLARDRLVAMGVEPVDYSLSRTGIRPVRDLLDMFRLTRLLRRLQPDLCFGYFIKPVIYGGIAAWLAGVPRRYAMIEGAGYVFSAAPDGLSWRRRLLRRAVILLYRAGLAGAHRVLFLNRDDLTLFVESGMTCEKKVRLTGPIGVDLAHFAWVDPVAHPPTFLLCARLLAEKGVREFVAAARIVRDACPQAHFILVGSPDDNPGSVTEVELEGWAREGVVQWQAHVDDVRPWIARASVCVQPTWYREGVPRGIQEAMAMGRPVITTDMPGCRDAVADGETGFVIAPRNVAALAGAMRRFIDEPELIVSMGRTARDYAEHFFDAEKASQRILDAMSS